MHVMHFTLSNEIITHKLYYTYIVKYLLGFLNHLKVALPTFMTININIKTYEYFNFKILWVQSST